jgi:hypothetical protein
MCLHLPVVGLISAGKVRRCLGVVLHGPQPVENSLAEGSTVRITEGTAVSDGNVTLP